MIRHCYYMTQRPPMPGAQPKEGLVNIESFDGRPYIEEIDHEAYALLTYDRVLADSELREYELVPDQFERMYALSWYTITGRRRPERVEGGLRKGTAGTGHRRCHRVGSFHRRGDE